MDCRSRLEALSCFTGKPPVFGGFLSTHLLSTSLRDGKIPAQRGLIYWEKLRGIRSNMAGGTKTPGWSLARDRPFKARAVGSNLFVEVASRFPPGNLSISS